jgi:hypothetical protein
MYPNRCKRSIRSKHSVPSHYFLARGGLRLKAEKMGRHGGHPSLALADANAALFDGSRLRLAQGVARNAPDKGSENRIPQQRNALKFQPGKLKSLDNPKDKQSRF